MKEKERGKEKRKEKKEREKQVWGKCQPAAEWGALVTKDTEKAELLNVFFDLVFTAKINLQESQTLKIRDKDKSRERTFPWLKRSEII